MLADIFNKTMDESLCRGNSIFHSRADVAVKSEHIVLNPNVSNLLLQFS